MLDVVQKENLTYHVGYSWSIWTSDEIGEKVNHHESSFGSLKQCIYDHILKTVHENFKLC